MNFDFIIKLYSTCKEHLYSESFSFWAFLLNLYEFYFIIVFIITLLYVNILKNKSKDEKKLGFLSYGKFFVIFLKSYFIMVFFSTIVLLFIHILKIITWEFLIFNLFLIKWSYFSNISYFLYSSFYHITIEGFLFKIVIVFMFYIYFKNFLKFLNFNLENFSDILFLHIDNKNDRYKYGNGQVEVDKKIIDLPVWLQKEHYFFFVFLIISCSQISFVNNFLFLYLCLELYSLSSYFLIASPLTKTSLEKTIIYFMISTLGSVFLLLGISITFLVTGSITFSNIYLLLLPQLTTMVKITLSFSFSLLLIGLFFKFGIAPFHFWSLNVYESLPMFLFALFMLFPKIVLLYIVYKLIFYVYYGLYLKNIFIFFGFINLFFGTFSALKEDNWRRILTFSSLTNFGYCLLALSTYSTIGALASFLYFLNYIAIIFYFFYLYNEGFNFIKNNYPKKQLDFSNLKSLKELFSKSNYSIISVFFALTGLPPSNLFFCKFFILYTFVLHSAYALSIFFLLFSAVGCFVYLKIIIIFLDGKKFIYSHKNMILNLKYRNKKIN